MENRTPIQAKLAVLQTKKWTLAAIADELSLTVSTLEKWKSGERNPANKQAVMEMLDRIEKKKRIPKQKRYTKDIRG